MIAIDLSHRAKLRLTGPDRVRYLNGQATNDVRRATAAASVHSCLLTAKGKLCAVIYVTAEPDALLLDCDAIQREAIVARLEKYIIADDVVVEDVTDELGLLHLLPERDEELPAGLSGPLSDRYGRLGMDIYGSIGFATAVGYPIAGADVVEALRIQRGIPVWGRELDENTLPNEAGLEACTVDYQKGCYVGQEVISRLKSMGHVNRRLHRLRGSAPLVAGMVLLAVDGSPAGRITSAQGEHALGYIRRGKEGAPLLARDANNGRPACEVEILPDHAKG